MTVLSLLNISYSQDSSLVKSTTKWGIGISSTIFNAYNDQDLNTINTKISVPIFIIPDKIKLEPFGGYSIVNFDKKEENLYTEENQIKVNSIIVGLGVFFIKEYGNTKVSFGMDIGYLRAQYKEIENPNQYYEQSYDSKGDGVVFTPIIGGEYFLSNHFSCGAEAHFEWIKMDFKGKDKDLYNIVEFSSALNQYTTKGVFVFRFYFN